MLKDPDLISLQEVRSKVEKAYAAWQKYRSYSQEQVDALVEQVASAARANARRLAELAVEETGYGNADDKLSKNLLASDVLPRAMRGLKTIGVLREIPEQKMVEIGVPMGVVAAILPTTNPTSTAIYKTLISLKAGNAIVLSPHPRAKACTCETAAVLQQAALEAGAPEGLIQCIYQLHDRRHRRIDEASADRRDPFHRRQRNRPRGVLERQACVRRWPRQCSGAARQIGGRRRSGWQGGGRKVLRFRHGLFERAGDRRRARTAGTNSGGVEGAPGISLRRPTDGGTDKAAGNAELRHQSGLCWTIAGKDRTDGRF